MSDACKNILGLLSHQVDKNNNDHSHSQEGWKLQNYRYGLVAEIWKILVCCASSALMRTIRTQSHSCLHKSHSEFKGSYFYPAVPEDLVFFSSSIQYSVATKRPDSLFVSTCMACMLSSNMSRCPRNTDSICFLVLISAASLGKKMSFLSCLYVCRLGMFRGGGFKLNSFGSNEDLSNQILRRVSTCPGSSVWSIRGGVGLTVCSTVLYMYCISQLCQLSVSPCPLFTASNPQESFSCCLLHVILWYLRRTKFCVDFN